MMVLGMMATYLVMISFVISFLINLYVFLIIIFLLFDYTIGHKIFIEDIHNERKKKIKIVKKDLK